MKGRRKTWTPERRTAAIPVNHGDRKLRRDRDMSPRADLCQERERFAIAAQQDVLSVVDELTGVPIDERGRAPAKAGPRFEQQHAQTRAGEADARTQAGDPTADD